MPTQIELSYLLKKNQDSDLFDSYLPVRIPIAGETKFMNQVDINAEAANAFLGVRIQQTDGQQILHLFRLSDTGGLSFPDETFPDLEFEKVSFRILSDLTDNQDQHVDYSTSYEIEERNRYHIVPANVLPQLQWLALVAQENGHFRFLHSRRDPGDAGVGGDPCELAGCNNPDRTIITAIACACKGCG
jgi:hypothetical protein